MIYANNEHIFLCYSVIIATIYPDFTIPFRYLCLTTVLFSRSLESCHRSYVRRSLSKIINLLHARQHRERRGRSSILFNKNTGYALQKYKKIIDYLFDDNRDNLIDN